MVFWANGTETDWAVRIRGVLRARVRVDVRSSAGGALDHGELTFLALEDACAGGLVCESPVDGVDSERDALNLERRDGRSGLVSGWAGTDSATWCAS